MSTEPDKLKLRVFLAILAVIALVINGMVSSLFSRVAYPVPQERPAFRPASPTVIAQPERQVAPTPEFHQQEVTWRQVPATDTPTQRSPSEDPALQRANYIAKYVSSGTVTKPGLKTVAVTIVSEDNTFDPSLNAAVAAHFRTNSVEIVPSFFKPAFVTDGLFTEALAGSTAVFEKLDISNSIDLLVLGREDVQYSTDPSLENVITAKMRLEVTARSVTTGESQSWTFTASGAGFKRTEARSMAGERLIKQISKDTKMCLNP